MAPIRAADWISGSPINGPCSVRAPQAHCEVSYVDSHSTMRTLSLITWLAFASLILAEQSLWSKSRPFELQLIRNTETGACNPISLRDTQTVRGLRDDSAHITKLSTSTGDEKVSIIAYDKAILWERATSLCGSDWPQVHDTQSPQANYALQEVLHPASAVVATHIAPTPALEIYFLGESGPSSNRVDLVFFSDGCKRLG